MGELTHFNEQGRARMVDVTEKPVTHRRARGRRRESMFPPETMAQIRERHAEKGGCAGRGAGGGDSGR